jgi:hypothetical protein
LQRRRDQHKYLNLIQAVAFLRQMQKPRRHWGSNGQSREYIEVDLTDLRLANELATDILGHSLEELSRPGYELLMLMEKMVLADGHQRLKEKDDDAPLRFGRCISRRDIREFTGWSHARVHRYLRELIELEYVLVESGRNGVLQRYRLAYDGQGKDGRKFVLGLKPVDELQARA